MLVDILWSNYKNRKYWYWPKRFCKIHSLWDSRHVFHLFEPEWFWFQEMYLLNLNIFTFLFAGSFEPLWVFTHSESAIRLGSFDFCQDGCRTAVLSEFGYCYLSVFTDGKCDYTLQLMYKHYLVEQTVSLHKVHWVAIMELFMSTDLLKQTEFVCWH